MKTTAAISSPPGETFRTLVTRWKEDSQFLSNTAQMALLVPYQKIIGMGPAVVPAILEELRREPDHWFWALEMVTGENPVTPADRGNFEAMRTAWLEWGNARGLLS